MLTFKIGNACWQLYEHVPSGNVVMLLDCKAHCFNCIFCNCANLIWQGSSPLYSLGVTDYPWEVVGLDFCDLLKFNFATIIDPCLPSYMAHFLSCH